MFKNLVLFLCALPVYAAPQFSGDLYQLLNNKANRWTNGTAISFPGSTQFESSTQRWTPADAPNYSASVSPANERDIATLVSDKESNQKIASLIQDIVAQTCHFSQYSLPRYWCPAWLY